MGDLLCFSYYFGFTPSRLQLKLWSVSLRLFYLVGTNYIGLQFLSSYLLFGFNVFCAACLAYHPRNAVWEQCAQDVGLCGSFLRDLGHSSSDFLIAPNSIFVCDQAVHPFTCRKLTNVPRRSNRELRVRFNTFSSLSGILSFSSPDCFGFSLVPLSSCCMCVFQLL